MIQNLIFMNGYGLFVWSSFLITFAACGLFFFKTLKTLKKYEKEFALEIEELSKKDKKVLLRKSKIASQVFSSYSKTI